MSVICKARMWTSPGRSLISPLKIEQYYKAHQDEFKVDDQVKLRMIVISQPEDGSPGEARKIANEVLAKIDSGVSFAEMAGIYSSESQRADGARRTRVWVDRSYFKPELAEIAFSLKSGEHSRVIELPEACYILMVEDVRPAHIKSLVEVRSDIERTLKSEEKSPLAPTMDSTAAKKILYTILLTPMTGWIAISLGDVTGIGPEVTLKALAEETKSDDTRYLLIGDSRLHRETLRATWTAIWEASTLFRIWFRGPRFPA